MSLTKKQIEEIRKEAEESTRPLIFFHDDADGLASFLLLYRFIREGKGIIIKTSPNIDEKFIRNVQEYNPDKIFIVDIAIVEQDFIDKAKTKIIWIDHHQPLNRHNIKYYNPRIKNPSQNIPASYSCYQVVKKDLWIAMIGCIGDWVMPPFAKEFTKKYPDLLSAKIKNPETALFETKLGKLIKIISFCLKGTTKEAMQHVKILTRINSPYEILNQETPAGRFLYKKYEKIDKEYQKLLKLASRRKSSDKVLLFQYYADKMSFTKDISNELLHKFPNKVIMVAREKGDEIKISLRSKDILIPPILEKALKNIEGHGGGHEHACGANVKKRDFGLFFNNFKKLIK